MYSQQETHYNASACGLEHTCAEAASPDANAAGGSTAGIGGGIFLDLFHRGGLHAGLDLRAAGGSGSGLGSEMVEFSVRIALVPKQHRFSPYADFGIGHASGHTTSSLGCLGCPSGDGPVETASNAFFGLTIGLDIRLNDRFDLRLLDLSAAAGTLGTPPTTSFLIQPIEVSTGVVAHFGRRGR
jgi:hypothetical protein